ncbi:MAG: YihY/virulence factor BrkB family protein [Phycisphaerales bacterium]
MNPIAKIQEILAAEPDEDRTFGRFERAVRYCYVLARLGGRQLVTHRAPMMASALAYRTIFSLVPLLVLALVVLNAFYGRDGVRKIFDALFSYVGISDINLQDESLSGYIESFVNNAADKVSELNFGVITVVGIAVLIYAALSLLIQIETSFNTVTRAASGRRLVARLTTYWTLITLGSLGLVLSFSLGQGYERLLEGLPAWASWATAPVRLLTKIGVSWLVLLFAYTRMPNARVPLKPAAIGAVIAAILWELAKSGLTWFVLELTVERVQIYGSLALLPVFLLWIYFTWLIVLFGLEVACAIEAVTPERMATLGREHEQLKGFDPTDAILVTSTLAEAFDDGRTLELNRLVDAVGGRTDAIHDLVKALVDERFVNRVENDADEVAYALARPPEKIAATDVLDLAWRLRHAADRPEQMDLAERLRSTQRNAFDGMSIREFASKQSGSE